MIHFHRYQWGEVEIEVWERHPPYQYHFSARQPIQYERTMQIGKCSCGKAKKRYLS